MRPKYCPKCKDPWDEEPILLEEYRGVLYCSGPDGDSPCGFHWKDNQRFRFKYRRPIFLWMLLWLISFGSISLATKVPA